MTENNKPIPNVNHPNPSTYPPILQFGTDSPIYAPQDEQNPAQPSPKPLNSFGITGFIIAILCTLLTVFIFSKLFVVFGGKQIELENDYVTIWLFLLALSCVFSIIGVIVSSRLNGSGLGLSVAGIATSITLFFTGIITVIVTGFIDTLNSLSNWV